MVNTDHLSGSLYVVISSDRKTDRKDIETLGSLDRDTGFYFSFEEKYNTTESLQEKKDANHDCKLKEMMNL